MKKLYLLTVSMLVVSTAFAQESLRSMAPVITKKLVDNLEFRQAEGDTLFYYDCSNLYITDDADVEAFELMREDFDGGIPYPYADVTETDISEYVSGFFWIYDRDSTNNKPLAPNGDLTFDWDENTDPNVSDTAWYFTAYSWFTDASIQADNWLGMGPVTIPDAGAALKFHQRGKKDFIDGFDVYITTGGMEPYEDIDPGETDIAFSYQEHTSNDPSFQAKDTIWTQKTVSLNDFAGESIYFTFHHHSRDMERLMLDNFLIVETNDMAINETQLNGISIYPNPSEGVFTVNSTEADSYTIEVINVLGEIVSVKTVEGMMNETFNMSHYNAGLYFVKIANGTSENVQRMVIK